MHFSHVDCIKVSNFTCQKIQKYRNLQLPTTRCIDLICMLNYVKEFIFTVKVFNQAQAQLQLEIEQVFLILNK